MDGQDSVARHAAGVQFRARLALVLAAAGIGMLTGCAALHPLRGVPASYMPHEYRGEQRSGKETINLSLLVRRPPDEYRVDAGDVLSVYIPGVLGKLSVSLEEAGEEPPINNPYSPADPPTIGYPVTVRDVGTIPLPYVSPVHVAGRTLPEVEDAIRRAYTVDSTILANVEGIERRIVVSLQRPREYRILVVRQEMSDMQASQNQVSNLNIGNSKRGTAKIVQLRAYENDVLHALARAEGADGLPGLDAENTIYVIRRRNREANGPAAPGWGPAPAAPAAQPMFGPAGHNTGFHPYGGQQAAVTPAGGHSAHGPDAYRVMQTGHSTFSTPGMSPIPDSGPTMPGWPAADWGWSGNPSNRYTMGDPNIIRIPVRLGHGEYPHISEDDITLYDGDIVFIESRETEVFYTGGLLGGGQFTLPRDYDITVTQAISIAQAQGSTASSPRGVGGVSALNSDVTISPSRIVVLRTLPDGRRFPIEIDMYKALRRQQEDILVQPGDMILLQYTKAEAVAAFFERHLLEGALFGIATAQWQTGNSGN